MAIVQRTEDGCAHRDPSWVVQRGRASVQIATRLSPDGFGFRRISVCKQDRAIQRYAYSSVGETLIEFG